jgi:hypothetical protein
MLHRIFAMLIVGFWIAMTGLLVVREMYPEATRLNTMPTGYVANLLFQHLQPSDLHIYDAGKEVGYAHMQPRLAPENGAKMIDFHGGLTINPIGLQKQHLTWNGTLELDKKHDLRWLSLKVATQEPPNRLDLYVDMEANTAQYAVRSGNQLMDQNTITMDRPGLMKILDRVGFDAGLLQQFQGAASQTEPPEFTAQQSSTRLSGETVSTYLVSLKVSGQTLIDAHVSQLGQVLRAQIPLFDYKLSPHNVAP